MTPAPPALLAALALAGCYVSSPPARPYGGEPFELRALAPLAPAPAAPLASPRLLILGRFDSTALQPIGGLYADARAAQPARTYFFPDAPLVLFEATSDALRARGLDVRKDYATEGEPALVEPRLRRQDPRLVSARILALEHDQAGEGGEAFEAARLRIVVEVRELGGRSRFRRELTIAGRAPSAPGLDLLALLGERLAGELARDADFLRAIDAAR